MPTDNPFLQYLEDRPEAGYFSYQNQWNTPNMKKYFQSQFGNIQNQYLGQLANWVKGGSSGQTPQFSKFLSNLNWGQEFGQRTPQDRGQDTSRFSPFTRWQV